MFVLAPQSGSDTFFSTSPDWLSRRHSAMSPSETMPTGTSFCPVTSRRRTWRFSNSSHASSTSASELQESTSRVMTSSTRVWLGSMPRATARTVMSRSVMMPTTRRGSSHTGSEPMSCEAIFFAASARLACGVMVAMPPVMMAASFMSLLCRPALRLARGPALRFFRGFFRGFFLFVRHALLEERHQVDHVGPRRLLLAGFGRGELLGLALLDLFLDARHEVVAIRVLELLGPPLLGHVVDQPQRHVELLGARLVAQRAARHAELVRGPDLVGVAQRVHQQHVVLRHHGREVLARADHD